MTMLFNYLFHKQNDAAPGQIFLFILLHAICMLVCCDNNHLYDFLCASVSIYVAVDS